MSGEPVDFPAGPYPRPCARCGAPLVRGDIAWRVKIRDRFAVRFEIWCEPCGERP